MRRSSSQIEPRGWQRIALLSSCTLLLAWTWWVAPPTITRGPYLQSPSATAVTVVLRTSSAAAVTVRYGPHAGVAWESSRTSPAGTTHALELTDLRPDTRYYYQVESNGAVLASGAEFCFRTSPPANARAPLRFVAWGDSGTGSSLQYDVARRMEELVPQPDFALGLGDLVYDAGQWENYDPNLFTPYKKLFGRVPFWPTLGNHDYVTQSGAPYLDAFYLPTHTGAPGHPSNTEKYYSFDQGMAHFTCADSESSSTAPGSAMYTWLADDLDDARARGKRWLIVFMHHPPYSHGTHDSDSEAELITLRQDLVPLFDQKDVDLVMVGHSHVYERSYLARNSQIFQSSPNDYTKIGSPNGTLYVVSGCGGASGSGSLDHPLMSVSRGNVAGFSLVDVTWEELRGSFVERDGRTTDLFRLHKSPDTQPPRVTSVRATGANEVRVTFDEPVRAGTSASGAENLANYLPILAAVRGAVLGSDQKTVTLSTTNLVPNLGYAMFVRGVADANGNLPSAVQSAAFTWSGQASGGSGGPPFLDHGTTWHYLTGGTPPPAGWTGRTFADASWRAGRAPYGYGYGGEHTLLADMKDGYATIYLRQSFSVSDPLLVSRLALDVAFDDGFIAYLNGVEIARGNMPAGSVVNTTMASTSHEVAGFQSFDVSAARGALVAGTNVLAIEGHNFTLGSPDFWLDLGLVPTFASAGSGNPPIAVIDGAVQTANAPATIAFSGALSRDPDGSPLGAYVWDFGDGTSGRGKHVQHTYISDGTYVVTLGVRDRQLLDGLATRTITIQSLGTAPLVQLHASATQVSRGTSVSFDSAGSLDPDGGALYAYWDFADPASGEANHSTAVSASHAFAVVGDYLVTLAITDDEGSTATRTLAIAVR